MCNFIFDLSWIHCSHNRWSKQALLPALAAVADITRSAGPAVAVVSGKTAVVTALLVDAVGQAGIQAVTVEADLFARAEAASA
jgi:hypothetical protein